MDKNEFIQKANKIHNNKYDYSKVEYKGTTKKVCIVCPEHGEFWQSVGNHLRGCGCNICSHKRPIKYNTEYIINEFKKVHGNKYDYSKVEYKGITKKVCIVCPEHGEFWQTPHSHLKGSTCPKCAIKRISKLNTMTTDEYINKLKLVHGNKYDYSKVEYTGIEEKVCIVCPKHGEFELLAVAHLKGQGCPKCHEYKFERKVRVFLEKNKINYIHQYFPDFLKENKSHQSLDFYLPDYNIAIECQGIQHYKPVKKFGGEEQFKRGKELDNKKFIKCKENNIKILYYSTCKYRNETDISNLNDLLYEIQHNT